VNRKSGVILGIALIIFLVISIIGAALMTVVMSRARQTNDLEKRTQAYFFARSGVEIAREYVNEISKSDEQFFDEKVIVLHGDLSSEDNGELSFHFQDVTNVWSKDNVRASFEASASSFRNHEVVTAIWRNSESTNFLSSGNVGDMTRTLAFMCSEGSAGIPVFDMAIFADGKIETGASANSKVIGDIGTNSTDTSAISRQGNGGNGNRKNNKVAVYGDVYFGPGANLDGVDPGDYYMDGGKIGTLDSTRDYKGMLPEFPDFPVLPERGSLSVDSNESIINDDGYYENISVNPGKTLTIDTGAEGTVRSVVVDQLSLGLNSSIELSGSGKLNLHVKNNLNLPNGKGKLAFINNNGNPESIDRIVFYYTGDTLGNLDFKGTLFIHNDNGVSLGGNSTLNVSGLIIYDGAGNVSMKGTPEAHSIALFAPNSKVIMTGNADFHGAIVCDEYDGSGGPDVIYKDIEEEFTEASLEIISGDGEEAFEQWGE
jgi:filamentous hemagglutinin family protein